MLQGLKQFILRGNVLDLAVAVVMGVAFGAVVTALVKDLITPFIAAIVGKPDFSAIEFTINGSKFPIGDFINAVISFILIAAAVYFFIVLPMNTLLAPNAARRGGTRSDDQEMPRMPQRNTYRGTTLRFLHLPAHRSHDALRDIVSRTFISISIVSACGRNGRREFTIRGLLPVASRTR
jgi:large conductance mechanosensitive channel